MTVACTRPYPWPWDGRVDPRHLALVVAGWDDHWMAAAPLQSDELDNIGRLAALCPNTFLLHHRPPVRSDVVARIGGLPTGVNGRAVVAPGIDGFYASELDSLLRSIGCRQLLIAGCGLETTVHSTLRRANDMGLECLVVTDACASADPTLTASAISSIELSGGIFGAVGTTDAVVDALASRNQEEIP